MKAADSDGPALLKAAIWYARHGWYVFPLAPGLKCPWKGSRGLLEATTDLDQIASWWQREPQSNIGIACGPSGLAVLDIDDEASFEVLRDELGAGDFDTVRQKTPSGGTHYVFAGKIATGADVFGAGMSNLDTRGEGGYIVADPSIVDGKSYAWEAGASRTIIRCSRGPTNFARKPDLPLHSTFLETPQTIPLHSRDNTLTRIAGVLRSRGFATPEIEAALLQVNARPS